MSGTDPRVPPLSVLPLSLAPVRSGAGYTSRGPLRHAQHQQDVPSPRDDIDGLQKPPELAFSRLGNASC